jgi:hypothetical protein
MFSIEPKEIKSSESVNSNGVIMTFYVFLFKGGLRTSELSKEYLDRFVNWAKMVSSPKIPGNRFKQEGKVVSSEGVDDLKFNKDTVGGYIVVEADDYGTAVEISKGCPILENAGSVEIREIVPPNA